MQHDHVVAFDILTGPPALGEGGICGQNICYHVAAIRDSIQFDLLTPSLGFWGRGSASKIFAAMLLLHS